LAKMILEGNQALAVGAKLCRPKVIASYPITPSTHIPEMLSEFVANGELDADFINVESEHSAISACIGAQATGVRTFTATASQGLALMHEILYVASGMRLPIVMGVANRSLSAPINIWCDHNDTMAERDSGWMQFYSENNQEALDLVIQAYRIAEDERVLLPAMVTIDAYTLTHTFEPVDVPSQKEVDEFLPPYKPVYAILDLKYSQQKAMERAKEVIDEVFREFEEKFGRKYGKIEPYRIEGADVILVTLGSMSGTGKEVVDQLREEGAKVGLIKVTVFRPFPAEELREAVRRAKVVAVIDRDISLGFSGAMFANVSASLINEEKRPLLANFIVGLGGRDVRPEDFREIVDKSFRILEAGRVEKPVEWINVSGEVP